MKEKNNKLSYGKRLFLKSVIYTAAAISLIVIGYFSAAYFFT